MTIHYYPKKFRSQQQATDYACGRMVGEFMRAGHTVAGCGGTKEPDDGYVAYVDIKQKIGLGTVVAGLAVLAGIGVITYFLLRDENSSGKSYARLPMPPENNPYMTEEDIFYHGA